MHGVSTLRGALEVFENGVRLTKLKTRWIPYSQMENTSVWTRQDEVGVEIEIQGGESVRIEVPDAIGACREIESRIS
jgi:hypothetical protein